MQCSSTRPRRRSSSRVILLGLHSSNHGRQPTKAAVVAAVLIYLSIPGSPSSTSSRIAWFAFIGLAVPAAMVEGLDLRAALVRGRQLGVADYAQVLGSLAALVIVVGVTADALRALLLAQGDDGRAPPLPVSLMLSPMLFLGRRDAVSRPGGRVGSHHPHRRRRRDANLILLSTLTQQGVQTLKSNPRAPTEGEQGRRGLGCKVLAPVGDVGEFDFVNVVEAPDIAAVAKVSVAHVGTGLDEDRDAASARDRRLPPHTRIDPFGRWCDRAPCQKESVTCGSAARRVRAPACRAFGEDAARLAGVDPGDAARAAVDRGDARAGGPEVPIR